MHHSIRIASGGQRDVDEDNTARLFRYRAVLAREGFGAIEFYCYHQGLQYTFIFYGQISI